MANKTRQVARPKVLKVKSARSENVKSTKAGGSQTRKKDKDGNNKQVSDSEDSRRGDFDSEEDGVSLGSEASHVKELQERIDEIEPLMALRYNEYKVDQGLQDRLEDVDLPENLEDEATYLEWKNLHEKQSKATTDRELWAQRRLELITIGDEINQQKGTCTTTRMGSRNAKQGEGITTE